MLKSSKIIARRAAFLNSKPAIHSLHILQISQKFPKFAPVAQFRTFSTSPVHLRRKRTAEPEEPKWTLKDELSEILTKSNNPSKVANIAAYDLLMDRELRCDAEVEYIRAMVRARFQLRQILPVVESLDLDALFKGVPAFTRKLESVSGFMLTNKDLVLSHNEVTKIIGKCPQILLWEHKMYSSRLESLRRREWFPFFKNDLKPLITQSPEIWLLEPIQDLIEKMHYVLKNMNVQRKDSSEHTAHENELRKIAKKQILDQPLFDIKCRHQFLLRRGQWMPQNPRGQVVGGDHRNPTIEQILLTTLPDFCWKIAKCQPIDERDEFIGGRNKLLSPDQVEEVNEWKCAEYRQFEKIYQRELDLSKKSEEQKVVEEEDWVMKSGYRRGQNLLRRERNAYKKGYDYSREFVDNLLESDYDKELSRSTDASTLEIIKEMRQNQPKKSNSKHALAGARQSNPKGKYLRKPPKETFQKPGKVNKSRKR